MGINIGPLAYILEDIARKRRREREEKKDIKQEEDEQMKIEDKQRQRNSIYRFKDIIKSEDIT